MSESESQSENGESNTKYEAIEQLDTNELVTMLPPLAQAMQMGARASNREQLNQRFTQVLDHVLTRAPVAFRAAAGRAVALKFAECAALPQFIVTDGTDINEIGALVHASAASELAQRTLSTFGNSRMGEVQPIVHALMEDVSSICATLEAAVQSTWGTAAANLITYHKEVAKPCRQMAPQHAV